MMRSRTRACQVTARSGRLRSPSLRAPVGVNRAIETPRRCPD
jgi:hypothetical protein